MSNSQNALEIADLRAGYDASDVLLGMTLHVELVGLLRGDVQRGSTAAVACLDQRAILFQQAHRRRIIATHDRRSDVSL